MDVSEMNPAKDDYPATPRRRWLPPDEDRSPILIHPDAKKALIRLLMDDPGMRGVGYSEFVMGAVAMWRAYLHFKADAEACSHLGEGDPKVPCMRCTSILAALEGSLPAVNHSADHRSGYHIEFEPDCVACDDIYRSGKGS